jgi:hypothetical protein
LKFDEPEPNKLESKEIKGEEKVIKSEEIIQENIILEKENLDFIEEEQKNIDIKN